MPEVHERRLAAAKKLESAETSLLSTAVKLYKKGKADMRARKSASPGLRNLRTSMDNANAEGFWTEPNAVGAEQGKVSLMENLVPRNERPSHRLPAFSWMPFSLPLIGEKVDTIEWARQEVTDTSRILHEARCQLASDVSISSYDPESSTGHQDTLRHATRTGEAQTYPPLNSAFVLFNNQMAAHMAAQVLTHHLPYRMATKSVGVAPADVVWSNLNMNPYEVRIRTAISWAITLSMVVLCAIPGMSIRLVGDICLKGSHIPWVAVAFVGAVSNIHSLCSTYEWLAWLCRLPPVVGGIVSGILSPALLTILNMMLPIILRLLARFEGATQKTKIELSLMRRYFLFQVVVSAVLVVAMIQITDYVFR